MDNGNGDFLTITEAARLIGVSSKTIVRWEKAGKVRRSKRDFRGWRVFDGKDLKKLKAFRETIFYVFVTMALVLGSVVFAADLEVVSETAPAQAPASTPAEAPAAMSTSVSSPTIEKAKDDATPASTKKLMPMPPAVKTPVIGEPTRYTLGPDDVIEIIVRRHPEFSDKFIINGEGKIQYKFVGDIEIKGLTKTEVKDRISKILGKFIISPDVDVTILDYRSKIIYVIGEVGNPGKYYMKSDQISLREAVVQAGLPTLSAAMRRTTLVRPDKSGKPKEKVVDLYALLYEGKLNLDQIMIPGDVLVVPATLFAKIFRVINPISSAANSARSVTPYGM
ncbi:MAG: hypothetical protein AUJ74_06575 [Candidatus Omnitrophica bacterium CG1_02_44_16]|nr:MAG: hypothetical protein AUJ74_06575 [Candidatus Omnitrophica bacterium CG1_02_44_16]PIY83779.1 MAG: hypothetical protein COY78_01035 [Candidatus Omnitrophica bacterium CG_4_10_14_0_8_um_filter_44_12]PIZ83105.1 MAG: hypothetical protein COX96_09075 [Candidatus Omnitrophica bacterium CG_4_10_14_0_2_um_filter_44_9]